MKSLLRFVAAAVTAATLCAVALAGPAGNPKLEMTIASRGTVTLELFAKDAPKTTAHIVDLCRKKFYDGILIHRLEPGFVVQAGDPKTKTDGIDGPMIGSGGSGKNIPFEVNSRTHETGSLGMALSAPRSATGDSQWFINLGPNHQLDGDYCVFGKVSKGMNVVKQIKRGDKIVSIRIVK